jgi:hypothetical protein
MKCKAETAWTETCSKNACTPYLQCVNEQGTLHGLSVFKMRFYNNFVPQVHRHLRIDVLPEKAVLLLDNTPAHPSANVLKLDDCKLFVYVYLPCNMAALI